MSTNIDEANGEAGSALRSTISTIAGWLGLLLVLATIGYYAVTGNFDLPARGLLIAAFLALTAFVWLNPETIATAITGRGTRTALTTVIIVVLGVALVVALNWLYGLLASRVTGEFGRIDMTAGQSLTLSDQSIKAVKALPPGSLAVGFFRNDSTGVQDQRTADNLLKEYTKYNPNLTVQWVDPDVNIALATRYGLTTVNVVVFDTGQRHQTAASIREEDFTGAILKLLSPAQKSVAILNGPTMLAFSGGGQGALIASNAFSGLTNENYIVKNPINLVVSPTITVSDVDVLIVPPAPPDQPLSDTAVRAILGYLDSGGHVLLIGDPQAAPLPAAITSRFGLEDTRDFAVEQDQSQAWGQSFLNLVLFNYPSSDITVSMQNIPTIYRTAGIIRPPTSTITGFEVSTILQTSPSAVAAKLQTDSSGQGQLAPDTSIPAGYLSLGVSIQPTSPDATTPVTGTNVPRMIVVGDMDWISDDLMGQAGVGNSDLFKNMIAWLAQSEERISVRPKDATDRTMFLTNEQKNLIAWGTVVFLPLLALVGGGIVWWRRR